MSYQHSASIFEFGNDLIPYSFFLVHIFLSDLGLMEITGVAQKDCRICLGRVG